MAYKQNIEEFGWTSVPRDRSNIPDESHAGTSFVSINFNEIWPQTELVRKAQEHVRKQLPPETYNHSLRVYCFGHIIVTQHFSAWIASAPDKFFETWALTCLYHDIGTVPANHDATHLSFEFNGGFKALQDLQSFGAPRAQAESACEAIIRHQDPGDTGTVSRIGQLIQIAAEFDNAGWQPHLVHKDAIKQVVEQHPRLKWSSCFSSTLRTETTEKPWSHTTSLPGFADAVEKNEVMAPFE